LATPIISYLKDGMLPDNKEAARKLKVQATRFMLIKDVLYKMGFSCPYLRCFIPKEANYIMREVHEGVCGNHSGSWSLLHKLIRWDTIGLPCKKLPLHMSKLETSVRGLTALSGSQ